MPWNWPTSSTPAVCRESNSYRPCFRPQFHKHEGKVCGGVEIRVTDYVELRPYRCGVEVLVAVRKVAPEALVWRREAYEFVADRPAIDLLVGETASAGDAGSRNGPDPTSWIEASWADDEGFEEQFRSGMRPRSPVLLYSGRQPGWIG